MEKCNNGLIHQKPFKAQPTPFTLIPMELEYLTNPRPLGMAQRIWGFTSSTSPFRLYDVIFC